MKKANGFLNEYLFTLPAEWAESKSGLFRFLQVTDMGYFPNAQYHYRKREHGCDTAIFMYCQTGKGMVSVNTELPQTIEGGQAILIPPYTAHWYGADKDMPWSIYWVHFKGEILPSYLEMAQSGTSFSLPPRSEEEIIKEFYRSFEVLKTSVLKMPNFGSEYFLVCQSAGIILALAAGAEKPNPLSLKGEQAVDICIRYMKTNLSKALTLKQLADAAGFSASHLNFLFKQASGFAPVEYFLRMKIQAASKDLYFTKRPVKEIAIAYGIHDPYYFSRLFKKVMGVSPTKFREQPLG